MCYAAARLSIGGTQSLVRRTRDHCLGKMNTLDSLTEQQAFIVLNALPNIGPITLNRMLEELGGDPRAVFSAGRRRLEAVKGVGPVIAETIETWTAHLNLAREEERMAKSGADFITTRAPAYPKLL